MCPGRSAKTVVTTPVPGAARRCRAFTLVELLVVMAIMLVLATLAVGVAPKFRDRQKPAQAASDLQNSLTIAKQWALRDKRPRGIRLVNAQVGGLWQQVPPPSSVGPAIQFIEQPDDLVGQGGASLFYPAVNPPTAPPHPTPGFLVGGFASASGSTCLVDFSGGFPISQKAFWPVQPGDQLELNGATRQLFRIAAVLDPPSPGANANNLLLANDSGDPPPPVDVEGKPLTGFAGTAWRIIRQSRPRMGEAAISLPKDVVVDLSVNNTKSTWKATDYATAQQFPPSYNADPPATVNGHLDILFAPSGKVIGPWTTGRSIKLWVRDASLDPVAPGQPRFGGEQYLVCIATQTGLISIQPVDVTPDPKYGGAAYKQPYLFTQDGLSSGL